MRIPTGHIIFLVSTLLAKQTIQEKVLEVNLALDENNRIVSMSTTIISSTPTATAIETIETEFTKTSSFITETVDIRPTTKIKDDTGTDIVDDIWNILESDGLISATNTTSAANDDKLDIKSTSEPPLKKTSVKLNIKKKTKGRTATTKSTPKTRKQKKKKNLKDTRKPKSCNLEVKEDGSGSESDKSDCNRRRKKQCQVKRPRKRKPVKPLKSRKSSCHNFPSTLLHIHSSFAKVLTLPAMTDKSSCLIEQTVVIPPQIISIPTIPPPVSSRISAFKSKIDEKFFNCVTNYAGTLTNIHTEVSVLPLPTTSVTTTTETIFAPTTQILYQAIYTPYTVTATSTDTMFMVKVTTVCKGALGCNSCELDANGMVIPAGHLPPGIFATPINEINTNLYDILGYVGVNPKSFRAELQEFYSTTIISSLPLTRPIFSKLSSYVSAHASTTTTSSSHKHHHRKSFIKRIKNHIRRKY